MDLDGLPQLFNVLQGDMTLVGPPVMELELPLFDSVTSANDEHQWLKTGGFLIPKQYREPMLGDLIEDRIEMRNKGFSRLSIELMTTVQLLIACACRAKLWLAALITWFVRIISG
jgi:hypothetical protein